MNQFINNQIFVKMKKSLIFTVLMALAMSGFAQQYHFAATCESGQTLYYRITDAEAHTVILTHPFSENNLWFQGDYYQGFIHPTGNIIIPSEVSYNGVNYTVTAIDANTFFECDVTSVFIPNSVIDIIPEAFRFSTSLESITVDVENPVFYSESNALVRRADKALVAGCKATTIPDGIKTICASAFAGAGDGGDLVIPNSVKTIEDFAFHYCGFSGSLTLSDSLENIGLMAFYVSQFTGSLTIPDLVTEIKHHTFFKCQFTGDLTLSSSLARVDTCAFANTHFTGTLTIPNSMDFIGVVAFGGTKFSELVLGESVTTIAEDAFRGCDRLSGVLRLPASLTMIDKAAFKWTKFDEIYSPNRIPPTLASNSFDGYDTSIPIHIPFGCTEVYQNAEGWNYFTNFIEEEPILYTDYEPDTCKFITSSHESDFMFDIDLDGTVDMTLSGYTQHGAVLVNIALSNGFQLCRSNENTILNADSIKWWQSDDLSNGLPLDSYRKRFGFRKTVGEHYFYGWMEIYWDGIFVPEGKMIYLDRMAFCTISDYPFRWGQTSLDSITMEGSEWYYEILNDDGSITYQHLECTGDTVMQGKRPKVIVRSNTHYDRDTIMEETHEYIYEEGGIVYWWNKDLEEFTTLYNLNANVGDEWEIKVGTESLTMHVDAVENYEYEGRTYRMIKVSDPEDLFSGDIVCGIGHMTSFFPERLMNRDKNYRVEGMRCYWVDGELVFKLGDKDCDEVYEQLHNGVEDSHSAGPGTFVVYPNPANGILFVRLPQCDSPTTEQTEYRITNLMGQILLTGNISAETQQIDIANLSAGTYFISVGGQTVKFVKQ